MEELGKETAPSFTLHLRPRVVQQRDTCKLLCSLTGNPTPTVKWYKNKRELSKRDYSMTYRDGVATMKITDSSPEDSGNYSCVATNELGTAETNCFVTVEGKAVFAKKPLHSDEKREIEQPLKPAPAPTIRTTVTIEPPSKSSEPSHVSSKTKSPTKEIAPSISTSSMTKPCFARKLPEEDILKEGTPLLLSCSIRGDPDPTVEWYKDGKPLQSSEVVNLKLRHGVASLVINEVVPDDEGVYSLKAINCQGEAKTMCKVTVISAIPPDVPPRIVDHVISQNINDGEPVTLACRITEAENFDVVWLHNNEEIKSSEDLQYSSEEDVYKLYIAEMSPKKAGIYTCKAFNREGKSFSSCSLVVSVPGETLITPEYRDFPSSATLAAGKPCVFAAELKKTPLELQWLKDGEPINVRSNRYKLRMDGTSRYRFEIVRCTVDDNGQYLARAIGSKGDSFAAFYLNVFDDINK